MKLNFENIKRILICLSLIGLASACGEEEESLPNEGSASAKSLLASKSSFDLPSNLKEMTEYEMLSKMFSIEDVSNAGSPDDDSSDEDDRCTSDLIENVKMVASKTEISIVTNLDLTPCIETDDVTMDYSKSDFKMSFYIQCEGSDLSIYDGEKFQEIGDNTDAFKSCESGSMMMQMLVDFKANMEFSNDGESYEIPFNMYSAAFHGGSDFGPCDFDRTSSTTERIDDCIKVEVKNTYETEYDEEDEVFTSILDSKSFSKLVFNNVVAEEDATWYSSGSIDLIINNWEGSIPYLGSETAPTYTMTSSDGDTSTGTTQEYTEEEDEDDQDFVASDDSFSLATKVRNKGSLIMKKLKSMVSKIKK